MSNIESNTELLAEFFSIKVEFLHQLLTIYQGVHFTSFIKISLILQYEILEKVVTSICSMPRVFIIAINVSCWGKNWFRHSSFRRSGPALIGPCINCILKTKSLKQYYPKAVLIAVLILEGHSHVVSVTRPSERAIRNVVLFEGHVGVGRQFV